MKTTTTTTTRRRRRPTTPLKKAFLGLGVLGFGASTTTTMIMALETECDVCHVNYFHKVERFSFFSIVFLSLFRDVAAECDDDDALFLSALE